MRGSKSLPALAMLATVLAGCLGGSAPPEPLPPDDGEVLGPGDPGPGDDPPPPPPPRTQAPPPASTAPPPAAPSEPAFDPGPQAVIAHIDTGINPYHRAFRDFSALAQVHPSTYLPGFPADAPALRLTLGAGTYEDAVTADATVWAGVEDGQLYWIPGTRIVGAIRMGPGGVLCPQAPVTQPPLPAPAPALPALPNVPQRVECPERPLLDDHGHGTMTASRMAGGEHSLCPACRIVSIEGLGPEGVRWAAEQGWIDVQTNSWGSRVPSVLPADQEVAGTAVIRDAFAFAAQRMLAFAASGNGLDFKGLVGEPTFQQATASAGVVVVGAHDNGRATLYHGFPPHVVADGYGGWRASARDVDEWGPFPDACCTSAAAPYAAGGAAGVLLEARRLAGHRGTGFPEGAGARGAAGSGPLDDGRLTLAELRALLLATATARPTEGADDGLLHWVARAPDGARPADPQDPGENPYCVGCWALPAEWFDLPPEAPLYPLLGYGAVDPLGVDLAMRVLRGEAAAPLRPDEDAFFAADARVRGALDGLP